MEKNNIINKQGAIASLKELKDIDNKNNQIKNNKQRDENEEYKTQSLVALKTSVKSKKLIEQGSKQGYIKRSYMIREDEVEMLYKLKAINPHADLGDIVTDAINEYFQKHYLKVFEEL